MAEYIEIPLSGRLRGVTYENGKVTDVHIMDTDDVVKVFVPARHGRWLCVDTDTEQFSCAIDARRKNTGKATTPQLRRKDGWRCGPWLK